MNKTGKQLTEKQRYQIEIMLNENSSLSDIASVLNRDPRGIKYEIMKHRKLFVRSNLRNKCGMQDSCVRNRLCPTCISGKCKYCRHMNCNEICNDFIAFPQCKRTLRFPCVCNGCPTLKDCQLPKVFYRSHEAHMEYKNTISKSKEGVKLSEVELKKLDSIIKEGVKRKLSLDVIIQQNHLDISVSTLYRYINDNLLSVKNIDLKRKVRYRQRYTKKIKVVPIDYDYLKDRRFIDFQSYYLENPDANIWQMDTMEGIKGGAGVLTLLYVKTNLQLYFKINSICQSEVIRIMDAIKKHLSPDVFKEVFACFLTDNGKEFRDPLGIICDPETGEILSTIFYCEPRRSDQKAKCEKNHEHFRECIPKGTDIAPITHAQMNHISNNVNNYPRKSLGYKSPLELSFELLNKKTFELNKLKLLPPAKIQLKRLSK